MRHKGVTDLLLVFAGKSSGVVVALVFLPFYNRVLGPEQFGIVAVLLSIQMLAIMMDLGMSTLVSRYAALSLAEPRQTALFLNHAELGLTVFYTGLLLLALLVWPALPSTHQLGPTAAVAVLLYWVMVLQNVYYTALLARTEFALANITLTLGALLRAAVTAAALVYIAATPLVFVVAQLLIAALHLVVTRISLNHSLQWQFAFGFGNTDYKMTDAWGLIKQGRPIILFTAAGAAVTQLDKPLVSAFSSAASVAPYFLATTLCTLPIALLAGPLSQYFQPKILIAIESNLHQAARQQLQRFVLLLLLAIGLPSLALWVLRDWAIAWWLGPGAANSVISQYVATMLPGFAIGALGFVPYALLLSCKDFRFQAQMSVALTVLTLVLVAFFAWQHRVDGVCFTYMFYHIASTACSWARACKLPQVGKLAWGALLFAGQGVALLCLVVALVLTLQHQFKLY